MSTTTTTNESTTNQTPRVKKGDLAKALSEASKTLNAHQLVWAPDHIDVDAYVEACKTAVKQCNAAIKVAETYRDQPEPQKREHKQFALAVAVLVQSAGMTEDQARETVRNAQQTQKQKEEAKK